MNFYLIIKGILIGIANIIPGVSGGTLAVILGIYDKLIESISEFLTTPQKRKEYLLFLVPVGVGVLIGLKGFASIIEFFLANHSQPTYLLFIGLILGSMPLIYNSHSDMALSPKRSLLFLIGFMLVASFVWVPTPEITEIKQVVLTLPLIIFLFISGALAAAAMVMPGISGSLLLLILGTYGYMIYAISSLNLGLIAIIGCGAVSGILTFTKVMNRCLKSYPSETYFIILGLMGGSLVKLWPGLSVNMLGLISLATFMVGLFLSYFFSKIKT